ncbi:IS5 family transposase ISSsv1 [Streptomyces sp. enrichment culture]
MHLDAGYDSDKTRALLSQRGLHGRIAHKGEKAPIQNAFHRLARCYERRLTVIGAFFDLADAVITVRSLIRQVWMTHRWDARPNRRP